VATIRPVALRFSARARSQLLAIHEYIDQRNPAAATRVGASIREAGKCCAIFRIRVAQGALSEQENGSCDSCPIFSCMIDAGEQRVTILGVFHCAQRRD
jgi:hypothetical protein